MAHYASKWQSYLLTDMCASLLSMTHIYLLLPWFTYAVVGTEILTPLVRVGTVYQIKWFQSTNEWYDTMYHITWYVNIDKCEFSIWPLQTESCHNANFVVTGAITIVCGTTNMTGLAFQCTKQCITVSSYFRSMWWLVTCCLLISFWKPYSIAQLGCKLYIIGFFSGFIYMCLMISTDV